jgi:muramoyltetrapeptide carboxypeptidase
LESALGTPYAGQFSGRFLALEEVGERGYRVDRMLEHLKQSKSLQGCLGIIFGEFLFGDERDGANYVSYALERFAKENSIACFSGLQIGHGDNNRMLAFGTKARLEKNILHVPTGVASQVTHQRKAKR